MFQIANKRKQRILSAILSLVMLLGLFSPLSTFMVSAEGESSMKITETKVDNRVNPLGIDSKTPTFAWKLGSSEKAQVQSAYQIIVDTVPEVNSATPMWDSGKVISDNSTEVVYEGTVLQSATRYYYKVRVWDGNGNVSEYSDIAWFETALYENSDWSDAKWIGGTNNVSFAAKSISFTNAYWIWHEADGIYWSSIPAVTRYFRKTINIDNISKLTEALVAVTCDDEYELYVNGVLAASTPSGKNWKTAQLADVKELLVSGKNVIAVKATNKLGAGGVQTGGGLLAAMQLVTTDGEQYIPTDSSWLTSDTEVSGYETIGFDDSGWAEAYANQKYGSSPWGAAVTIEKDELSASTNPAPYLRKEVALSGKVESARAYVSGLGYFVMTIDGKRVGDSVLDPGTSNYNKTAMYVVHDVTEYLNEGTHALGVELGRGFYGLPAEDTIFWNNASWIGEPRLKLKLAVKYKDGTEEVFVSNTDWKTASGPTLRDSLYMGETYDARLEQNGFDTVGFDDSNWDNAQELSAPTNNLRVQTIEPIRVTDTLDATEVTDLGDGKYVLKYPVVTAGWAKMTVSGDVGTTVTLTYGEKIRANGTVDNDGSSGLTTGPIQVDRYTLKGVGTETFEPKFSYKGFQYIQVEGYPGTAEQAKANIKAQVVHSDLASAGSFESSNELINQIHDITLRTILNNSHSIMSDTPMYEKRGWTGDANIMSKSIINNYDMQEYFNNWLISIAENHSADGGGTVISPNKSDGWSADPLWGGIMIGLPYEIYKAYGDTQVLENYYTQMKNEIGYYQKNRYESDSKLIKDGSYGDWVAPKGGENNTIADTPHKQPEDGRLLNTAYVYKYAKMMEEVATLLGKTSDATSFKEFANGLLTAFNEHFLNTEKGVYETGKGEGYRQTSNAVPLMFGMVPAEYEDIVAKNLAEHIKENDYDINCGFAGVKELFPALCKYGYTDVAFTLATQTDYPSYGFWIENGATTLWEMWELTSRSLDHNLHGSIDDWFYSYLGGITAKSAGYKEISIKPYVPTDLDYVNSSIKTSYGDVVSNWSKDSKGNLTLSIEIPVNTTASVSVPSGSVHNVYVGDTLAGNAEGVTYVNEKDGYVNYEVGSGSYTFSVNNKINVSFADENSYSYYNGNTNIFPFSEKVKYLTAISDYDNTELDVSGLTIDYMRSKFSAEDNEIKSWKIVGYTGAETTQIKTDDYLTALTDLDFYASGGASGTTKSSGTMATKDHNNSCWILSGKGYEDTVKTNLLYGQDRIDAGYYDAKVTLELKNKTAIDSVYLFSQWKTDNAIATYAIYVSDNESDLYNPENRVCLFDYYDAYAKDIAEVAASQENRPYKLTCRGRHSEGQLWNFNGQEKPTGKYVGVLVYDAALTTSNLGYLSIYDMGVFGKVSGGVDDVFSTEIKSTSDKTVVSAGEFKVAVKDAEGKSVKDLLGGENYTASVVGADSRYNFKGWYKEGVDTPITTNPTLSITDYQGDAYIAKFDTDVILSITPNTSNLNLKMKWVNAANKPEQTLSYDATEDALKLKVGNTEYNGAFCEGTIDGKNILDTQFEPWTTYKVNLKVKMVPHGVNKINNITIASIPSTITHDSSVSFGSTPTTNEYEEYSFYFNSGAADYDRADSLDNINTSKLTSQFLNFNGVSSWDSNTYADVYIKEYSIEKVENVYVDAPNANVTLGDAHNFKWASGSFTGGVTTNTEAYGGYGVVNGTMDKSLTAVNNWMKQDLKDNNIYGAADGVVTFTVTVDEGYKVDTVTVNGIAVEANEGVYTANYSALTAAEGKYDNSDVANIVVATLPRTQYAVTFKAEGQEDDVKYVYEGDDLTDIPAVPQKVGHTSAWDVTDFTNITENKVVNAVYTPIPLTVTYKAEGFDDIVINVNYGDTIEVPAVPVKEGFEGTWDVNLEGVQIKANTVVNAQYVATIVYYDVNFVDATQKVIKTIKVAEGEYLDPAVVNAIVVKEVYGYTVKRDNEGNVEWNEDVYANPVTAEITYTAQYKALDISSLITLYKTDSDEYFMHEHRKYDTAIDLVYEGANSWVDEKGVVLVGEPTGRIYASGDRMKIYAKSDIQEAPEVSIVGKAHEQGKGFSVFAHVNVADAEAYGIIFASDSFHSEKANFDITDVTPEGSATIRVQKIEVTTENVGKVDFMTTLNYKAGKPNPTRWARAYVVIDGQYYYSQVIGNKE